MITDFQDVTGAKGGRGKIFRCFCGVNFTTPWKGPGIRGS